MDGRTVKITLKRSEVRSMKKLYNDLLHEYTVEADDAHGLLLKEHIVALYPKWRNLEIKTEDLTRQKFHLHLTNTEALAYIQTWEGYILHFDPFTNLTIQQILTSIHQQTISRKPKAYIK